MGILLKIVRNIVIGVWLIVAIFITATLLSYNEFGITVINKNSFLIIDNDELTPDYKEGDLVIVKRDSDKKINAGDKVFFYNVNKSEYLINIGSVTDKRSITNTETTFEIEGKPVSGAYVIGKADDSTVISNIGSVLGVVQSRWGFMVFIILPSLFLTVYEVFLIIDDVKNSRREKQLDE